MSNAVHTAESAPIPSVEKGGVRKRGWMRPKISGSASHFAIDSVVRAVGRIVVWVDADADVSTAMISSLFQGEPKTALPSGLSTSAEFAPRNFVPANAMAAVETLT